MAPLRLPRRSHSGEDKQVCEYHIQGSGSDSFKCITSVVLVRVGAFCVFGIVKSLHKLKKFMDFFLGGGGGGGVGFN